MLQPVATKVALHVNHPIVPSLIPYVCVRVCVYAGNQTGKKKK